MASSLTGRIMEYSLFQAPRETREGKGEGTKTWLHGVLIEKLLMAWKSQHISQTNNICLQYSIQFNFIFHRYNEIQYIT